MVQQGVSIVFDVQVERGDYNLAAERSKFSLSRAGRTFQDEETELISAAIKEFVLKSRHFQFSYLQIPGDKIFNGSCSHDLTRYGTSAAYS